MDSVSNTPEDKIEELFEKKTKVKFEDRIPGCLSVIDLDYDEREYLLDYLSVTSPQSYSDFIFSLLGDKWFLSYMDVLEGLTIKIPPRQTLIKIINYIKIYCYLKSRGFSEEAYEKASKLYKKRVVSLKRIVNKVEETLQKKEEKND